MNRAPIRRYICQHCGQAYRHDRPACGRCGSFAIETVLTQRLQPPLTLHNGQTVTLRYTITHEA